MKLRREARTLKERAVASLKRSASAFNSYEEEGRIASVLLHLQHGFEMLLKAGLVQRGVKVFDPNLGRSIGFEKCVNLGREHLGLSEEEAGLLRAIDALRDGEQHWIGCLSEGLLYAHCRAGVTLFDDLLQRISGDRLSAHLPPRVLPISTDLPRDIQVLFDEEYSQIVSLLQPGKRRRTEARARISSLLALEAHVAEGVLVSNKDVRRVERAVQAGKERTQVFPRLSDLRADVSGEGLQVTVRFSKTSGAPVRFVGDSLEVEAAAIREVDLQRKFHWTKQALAEKLALSSPKCCALRRYLGVEEDETCRHDFVFGSQVHRQYSDNAYTRMRDALGSVDMQEVWRSHGARRGTGG